MKTFKTPKGTLLPLRDMKGKDYLDVQYRILWMREEHPEWSIETEFLTLGAEVAVAKATIRDGGGKIVAQGTKEETPLTFKLGFIEKAETGAIGRALGFSGYGTQFTVDLDEGERLADSPVEAPISHHGPNAGALGAFKITFGKFNGQTLDSIGAAELRNYYDWLKKNQKPGDQDSLTIKKIAEYVAGRTPKAVN